MKNTKLSELSTEELMLQQKEQNILFIFFGVMIGIMVAASIYTTITKGINAQTGMPLPFLLIYLFFWNNHKDLRNEIKSRKSN